MIVLEIQIRVAVLSPGATPERVLNGTVGELLQSKLTSEATGIVLDLRYKGYNVVLQDTSRTIANREVSNG